MFESILNEVGPLHTILFTQSNSTLKMGYSSLRVTPLWVLCPGVSVSLVVQRVASTILTMSKGLDGIF